MLAFLIVSALFGLAYYHFSKNAADEFIKLVLKEGEENSENDNLVLFC